MKPKYIGIILLAGALIIVSSIVLMVRDSDVPLLPRNIDNKQETPQTQSGVPDLTLKDHNGNDVSLRDIEGELVLLNSWASWCPFCVNELPDFGEAQKEFGDRITIVAINRGESRDRAKTYVQKRQVALHKRHPSFVLLHMAKHPSVRQHIHNTMKICDEEVQYAKQESQKDYNILLDAKISYYANLLMDGFDTFNMQELVIDVTGRLTAVRGTRFAYCLPIDQQPSFYPVGYTRLFNLSSPPASQKKCDAPKM